MTETDNPNHLPQGAIPNIERSKSRETTALERIFLLLDEGARKHKKSVTGSIHYVIVPVIVDEESVNGLLRINPVLKTNGKLSLIVMDFYQPPEGHSQQWVMSANWKHGKPNLEHLKPSQAQGGSKQFEVTKIAELAGDAIREKLDTEAVMKTSGGIIPLPIINTHSRIN